VAQPFDPGATGELLRREGMAPEHGRELMAATLAALV
jgi:hypothetical protein